MTPPKHSAAVTLLLGTTAVAASNAASGATTTTQDWYAAEQAKSLFKAIRKNLSRNSDAAADNINNDNNSNSNNNNIQRNLFGNTARANKRAFESLMKHQPPSNTAVINSMDEYDSFYIEISHADTTQKSGQSTIKSYGPCVWSECNIDDTDDAYMGDNRDGDEQWYQFRTQSFCANAAYTLYGRKKFSTNFFDKFGNQCSDGHFINSFFTYGGSDNLLTALGQTPSVYWGAEGAYSNSECVDAEGGYNGQAKYSTLGCSSSGEFTLAYFDGNSCDGNYFVGAQSNDKYNSAFESVKKCQNVDKTTVYNLLMNSWACDIRLYPNGCPDPYERKAYYEYALSVAHNKGNAVMAYRHLVWKDEIRALSWGLFTATLCILFAAFSVKTCVIKKKKGLGMPTSPTQREWQDALRSPTSSESIKTTSFETGNTRIEIEDGGRTQKAMEMVSEMTLRTAGHVFAGVAWLKAKAGIKSNSEPERVFQTSTSSESVHTETYKSPSRKKNIQLSVITTPTKDVKSSEEAHEVARTRTSPQGKVLESPMT
jgi:hypothetical protein